jgi:hypothetical protein
MLLFELNHDVLQSILSFLTYKPDLLNLGKTCRTAYHAITPHLLASIDFPRTHNKQLSFCKYMLSDAEHRIPAIKNFRFSKSVTYSLPRESDEEEAGTLPLWSMVAQILKQAHNIQNLTLHWSTLLLHDPSLAGAITEYPQLTTLDISPDILKHDILPRLHHLRKFTALDVPPDRDIFSFITQLQSTLEVLVVGGYHPSYDVLRYRDCEYRFTKLRRLELHWRTKIPTHDMTRIFPNLSELYLHPSFVGPLPHNPLSLNSGNSKCWPRLASLRGGRVLTLHQLALSCPVRHLYVEDPLKCYELDMFLELVQIAAPFSLKFGIGFDDINQTFFEQLVDRARDLKFLSLSEVSYLQMVSPLITLDEVTGSLTKIIWVAFRHK